MASVVATREVPGSLNLRKVCFLHIITHSKSPNTCTAWFFYLIELFGREKVVIGSEYAARGGFGATSRLRPDYVRTAHA